MCSSNPDYFHHMYQPILASVHHQKRATAYKLTLLIICNIRSTRNHTIQKVMNGLHHQLDSCQSDEEVEIETIDKEVTSHHIMIEEEGPVERGTSSI
jgi:hypothetical protein